MILGVGRAPGKVILCGEHAVVYGRPALAVPVTQVQAEAIVESAAPGTGITIYAADLNETIALGRAPADHPLALAVRLALAHLRGEDADQRDPDWRITVRSTIPVASGLGSGAAVSTALVRSVAAALAQQADAAWVSALVYEIEKVHHGTPSGIDNTVVAYERPVYFVRGRPAEPFAIGRPFTLVIADTGIRSPTRLTVGDVRRAWERERARYEALFDQVAGLVEAARSAIAAGEPARLGPLMDQNHMLLREIGVSCPELDALVTAARAAGALGAKLSGGGRGGNMVALATAEAAATVAKTLAAAGAVRVIVTKVAPGS